MIKRTVCGGKTELLATFSLAGRGFGFVLAGVSGVLLYFYLQTNPGDKKEIAVAVLFFSSLMLLGISLLRARLTIDPQFVEEKGLFRRKRIPLPEGTRVKRVGRSLELRSPSDEVCYRIDRSFNNGNKLEPELQELFADAIPVPQPRE